MGLKRYFFINGTYKGTLVGLFCLCLDYISSINFRFMSIDLETLFRKYLVWLPLAILLFILILVLSYYNFESKYGNDETKQ
ncbi:hypothetical protein C8N47_108103 [Mangrovibacterium marinum]|uniref:Uncharacterized protein n=1 Tax=Mangrovibacterium marinum TaxID=1639118 RepID=A0A2T5C1L0_9BACT|nr:hypothetical protein C8N47_108103 [Mangrovibacterium marinum]